MKYIAMPCPKEFGSEAWDNVVLSDDLDSILDDFQSETGWDVVGDRDWQNIGAYTFSFQNTFGDTYDCGVIREVADYTEVK